VQGLENPVTIRAADEVSEQAIEAIRPGEPTLPQLGKRLLRLFPAAQFGQAAREDAEAQGSFWALRDRICRALRRILVIVLQEMRDREEQKPHERLRIVRAQAQAAPQGLDRLPRPACQQTPPAKQQVAQRKARAQVDRPLRGSRDAASLSHGGAHDADRVVRVRIGLGELNRTTCRLPALGRVGRGIVAPSVDDEPRVAPAEPSVALGKRGGRRDGLAEQLARVDGLPW
jgi:hypothetical protein